MVTADGPKLVEYNVRFGDPEAQCVLPLLESDLAELALAATQGRLRGRPCRRPPRRRLHRRRRRPRLPRAPPSPAPPSPASNERLRTRAVLFPAGIVDGRTAGGRVLAVTGLGEDLAAARTAAYDAMAGISFEGMQVRRDIGWRAPGAGLASYAATGVDIAEGTRAVEQMRAAVERTHGAEVVRGVGSFGGSFSAKALASMDDPVLVASTDGVGTKVELAARLGRVRGVGADIVNHCINDVLVQSATPLVLPRLHRRQRHRRRPRGRGRHRHGRSVRGRRLHPARRRDRRDAGRLPAGRVRHRRHARRGGRAVPAAPPLPTSPSATC